MCSRFRWLAVFFLFSSTVAFSGDIFDDLEIRGFTVICDGGYGADVRDAKRSLKRNLEGIAEHLEKQGVDLDQHHILDSEIDTQSTTTRISGLSHGIATQCFLVRKKSSGPISKKAVSIPWSDDNFKAHGYRAISEKLVADGSARVCTSSFGEDTFLAALREAERRLRGVFVGLTQLGTDFDQIELSTPAVEAQNYVTGVHQVKIGHRYREHESKSGWAHICVGLKS